MNAYDGGCGAGSGHDNSKRKIGGKSNRLFLMIRTVVNYTESRWQLGCYTQKNSVLSFKGTFILKVDIQVLSNTKRKCFLTFQNSVLTDNAINLNSISFQIYLLPLLKLVASSAGGS